MSESTITQPQSTDRRTLLKTFGLAGAGLLAGGLLAGCGGDGDSSMSGGSNSQDAQILGAAKVAEALATTMYTGIIALSPFYSRLDQGDKNYFLAARDEEKYHYDLLKSATGNADAPLRYYFPTNMFTNDLTTLSVLVTLEEAFIAAYLLGVRQLSTPALRVLAAQIMGIESDHRTLARLIADEEGIANITGLSGSPEPTNPPNNNVYERTYGITNLDQVVNALKPFFDQAAANAAGHTVVRTFDPSYRPNFPGLKGNPPS